MPTLLSRNSLIWPKLIACLILLAAIALMALQAHTGVALIFAALLVGLTLSTVQDYLTASKARKGKPAINP